MDLKTKLLNADHDKIKNVTALFDLAYSTADYELGFVVRNICVEKSQKYKKEDPALANEFRELYKKTLLFEAPADLDSYMQYMEWNREPGKRFYLPRRKQLRPVVTELQRLANHEIELLAISMPPGTGKALANDTPVLTRHGWKTHGELVVGDELVAPDGEFTKVLAVHPKCDMEYEITFTNHEKVICHGNHIWTVFNKHKGKVEQIATKDMLDNYEAGTERERGHCYMYRLPHKRPFVGENRELFVDPYTLGAWLGDGSNQSPRMCNDFADSVIVQTIVEHGYPMRWGTTHKRTKIQYYEFEGLREALQKYGMCYSRRRTEKHIPVEYLTADIDQRLELLAGLLDTDGCRAKGQNAYQFTTSDVQLKEDFITLVSTFGWRCCVSECQPRASASGIIGRKVYWCLKFRPTLEIPCRVERKKLSTFSAPRMVSISSIKPVTEKVEGNCITVAGGEYCVGKNLIPTHNTTLALFFLTWLAGRDPEKPNLTGSHNTAFLRGAYEECVRMMDKEGEYLWKEIFPNSGIARTNAQDLAIDIDTAKRFSTLQFTSVGSGNAGRLRAEGLLYCDDLVSGIEQAMSKERLDKLWELYSTDLRQRKIGDCVELHIATRWSVHDIIGRLEAKYEGNPRAKFIVIPALDENGESNFDYGHAVGFSTEFYHDMRDTMDEFSWRALYENIPIEREGLLYAEGELRRYFELPDREPDAILACCDTKDKGTDYCGMPIVYQYGNDFFVEKMICDNSNPEIVEARLVSELMTHKVHMARFESNSAGGKIAEKVQKEISAKGGRTKITTKYTTQNKETKIIVNSPWVKEHCLFKDDSVIDDKEYRKALNFLCSYTMAGKNKNDDIPDVFAQLAEFVQSMQRPKVEIFTRPF